MPPKMNLEVTVNPSLPAAERGSIPSLTSPPSKTGNDIIIGGANAKLDFLAKNTTKRNTNTDAGTNSPSTPEDADDKGQEATFPQQLMDAIEQETKDGAIVTVDGQRVLEWLPVGDSFVIRDKAIFEKELLPHYFNAKCKFMSFVRKLYR